MRTDFTSRATLAEIFVRGLFCWPLAFPFYWLMYWPRRGVQKLASIFWSEEAGLWLWHEICTAANIMTSIRLFLVIKSFDPALSGDLALLTNLLFAAAVTDALDGYLARHWNEVTALGTWLDHISDWLVVSRVILILGMYETVRDAHIYLSVIGLFLLVLGGMYAAKFWNFYESTVSWTENIRAFALEQLQTNFWGRIQFVLIAVTLFGCLFAASASDPQFWLGWFMAFIPQTRQEQIILLAFTASCVLLWDSIRDAREYSETSIRQFREKLRQKKHGSR